MAEILDFRREMEVRAGCSLQSPSDCDLLWREEGTLAQRAVPSGLGNLFCGEVAVGHHWVAEGCRSYCRGEFCLVVMEILVPQQGMQTK